MIHEHASRVCEGGVNMFAMKIIFHLTTFLTCFATFWGDDDSGGWICCGVARYFVYIDISSPHKPCKIMKIFAKVRSISDRYRYLPFVCSRCTCSYCWLMMGEDVWEKTLHWSVVTRPDDTGPGWSRSVQVRDSDIMIIVIIALSLTTNWWSVWNRLAQLNSRNNVHMLRPLNHCLHEKLWSLRSDAAVLIISYAPN